MSSTDEKLDRISQSISRIDVTLAGQAVTLSEHIKRTEAAESAIEHIRAELKPLSTHVAIWGALAKIAGVLGALTTAALGIVKLLNLG